MQFVQIHIAPYILCIQGMRDEEERRDEEKTRRRGEEKRRE